MTPGTAARLFANFGAEEGEQEGGFRARAGRSVLAPLWALIFDASVELDDQSPLPERPRWFADEAAAFPWLRGVGGLVPWLRTAAADRHAAAQRQRSVGPAPEVVWQLSDKAWAHRAAQEASLLDASLASWCLPLDAALFERPQEIADRIHHHIAQQPEFPAGWTLKPRYGSSGRGRVTLPPRPTLAGLADDRVRGAFSRLAARGGAMLEPWLPRLRDLSVQLHIDAQRVSVLGTTEQLLRSSGVYEGNRGVYTDEGIRSGTPFDSALVEVAECIGGRMQAAGFVGPCGIDAFTFRHGTEERLRPVVEVNARFTTGTIAAGLVMRLGGAGLLRTQERWQFGLCPPHGGFAGLPGLRASHPLGVGGAGIAVIAPQS